MVSIHILWTEYGQMKTMATMRLELMSEFPLMVPRLLSVHINNTHRQRLMMLVPSGFSSVMTKMIPILKHMGHFMVKMPVTSMDGPLKSTLMPPKSLSVHQITTLVMVRFTTTNMTVKQTTMFSLAQWLILLITLVVKSEGHWHTMM